MGTMRLRTDEPSTDGRMMDVEMKGRRRPTKVFVDEMTYRTTTNETKIEKRYER